jgi:hypothetical protein
MEFSDRGRVTCLYFVYMMNIMSIQIVYLRKLFVWERMKLKDEKKKNRFFLEKSTGGLPNYSKQGDVLLGLNEKMKVKIEDLKRKLSSNS